MKWVLAKPNYIWSDLQVHEQSLEQSNTFSITMVEQFDGLAFGEYKRKWELREQAPYD